MPRNMYYENYSTLPARVVSVSWGRDSHVTVGAHECVSEEQSGNEIIESGFHVSLDRDQVNNVIRALRKARDQAFGRDE